MGDFIGYVQNTSIKKYRHGTIRLEINTTEYLAQTSFCTAEYISHPPPSLHLPYLSSLYLAHCTSYFVLSVSIRAGPNSPALIPPTHTVIYIIPTYLMVGALCLKPGATTTPRVRPTGGNIT